MHRNIIPNPLPLLDSWKRNPHRDKGILKLSLRSSVFSLITPTSLSSSLRSVAVRRKKAKEFFWVEVWQSRVVNPWLSCGIISICQLNKTIRCQKKPKRLFWSSGSVHQWTKYHCGVGLEFVDDMKVVPDQYLCLVHTLVYSFIFIVLMSGNTSALVPKIPETS
jgi:hypothetical protein